MLFLRAAALSLPLFFSIPVLGQSDNTVCSGSQMDWYTSVVGETPCKTYERLRQTCNAEYQLGKLSVNANTSTPPDLCNDQRSGCCCNTIAFSLSMLCLNCQQPIGTSIGIDGAVGTMQNYFNASTNGKPTNKPQCTKPTMGNFTTDIQTALCNQNIRTFDQLYPIMWENGAWFYVYTRDTIHQENNVAANNSFTKCPRTLTASGPNNSSASGAAPTTTVVIKSGAPLSGGAIAGIAFGVVALVTAVAAVIFFLYLRHRRNSRAGGRRSVFFETQSLTQTAGASGRYGSDSEIVRPYFPVQEGGESQIPPRKGGYSARAPTASRFSAADASRDGYGAGGSMNLSAELSGANALSALEIPPPRYQER